MSLHYLDWAIIFGFFAIALGIGIYTSRRAGLSAKEYFLSGKDMPWWLLGVSMVATTFSTDTPNLVTDLVRQNGVAGNWVWWAFLLTGMLTVFVYAKLWRSSGIDTDLEFYEMRYGGEGAKWLRIFRALYLGGAFNILAMSGVALAAIKIGDVMFGWDQWETIGLASAITLVFSLVGGFRGVVLTDFLLFFISIIGACGAAYVSIEASGMESLSQLLSHPNVSGKLNFIPDFEDPALFISIFLIPLAVQWWSSWYPGAEPGGGGYVAQRMLAAKDSKHAVGATLFFNVAHYALRPWPWIIVALASLVLYPDLESLRSAFPLIAEDKMGHDLAYPAMLKFLPVGLMGIVIASLAAAYMSTISTHLNWGASYFVHDVYKRVIRPDASEKEMVLAGRMSTLFLMVMAIYVAMSLQNAKQLFDIILMFGAGTGLIFILRWFWWRINIWSEISAMFSSGVIAFLIHKEIILTTIDASYHFPLSVLITTVIWLLVTFLTPPEDEEILQSFYKRIRPGGPGWKNYNMALANEENNRTDAWNVPYGMLCMIGGCMAVYGLLFFTGSVIYGQYFGSLAYLSASLLGMIIIYRTWPKLEL